MKGYKKEFKVRQGFTKLNWRKDLKLQNLNKILSSMGSVLVAYSGGVDSTLLLKLASDVLGYKKVTAVTAESLIFPSWEVDFAKKIAKKFKVKHIIIKTEELENPKFINNCEDRCYWCKKELFSQLSSIAKKEGLESVIEGTNFDDTRDFRPGIRAAGEFRIRSPLKEAGFTKGDIRKLSKKLNLPTWNKPSFACLATRFPYGMKITKKNIIKVSKAEAFLRSFGITQVRVRHYDEIVRIEVLKDEMPKLLSEEVRDRIIKKFKKLGYIYITVDLQGYRTGSMNEVLK